MFSLFFHRTDITLLRQERQPGITPDCLIFYGYQYLLPIRQFQTIDSHKMFCVMTYQRKIIIHCNRSDK